MAIIRWDPLRELAQVQNQIDRIFNEPFESIGLSNQLGLTTPVADVYEEDGKLVVEAHLPNFKREEVDVNVHDGALEVRAQHKEKAEDKGKRRYMLRESSASFFRRVGLPKNVDTDKIAADFSDGMLKVSVPLKDLPKPKKIAISGPQSAKK